MGVVQRSFTGASLCDLGQYSGDMMARTTRRTNIENNRRSRWRSVGFTVGLVGLAAVALGGCSTKDLSVLGGDPIKVSVRDSTCTMGAEGSPAGKVVFDVQNEGSGKAGFVVYANDGKTEIGSVDNIASGASGRLKLTLTPGGFVAACKPGMTGDGIRSPFEVNGDNLAAE
jgi:iron uptake system component EfeO